MSGGSAWASRALSKLAVSPNSPGALLFSIHLIAAKISSLEGGGANIQ